MHSLVRYLELSANLYPSKVAVEDTKELYTYEQLRNRSLCVANALDENITNQPIVLFLPKNIDAIASIFGILYSGNFYSPLDEKTPKERLKTILIQLNAPFIITTHTLRKQIQDALNETELNTKIICIEDVSDAPTPSHSSCTARCGQVVDTDPIYVIHTSGSTGTPKGVVISHRSVHDYIVWAENCYKVDQSEILGNQAPLCFDNSTLDLYLAIKTGATLNLIPEYLFSFPLRLVEYLTEKRISFIFWVPTALGSVEKANSLSHCKSPHLNKILFAGEVMPPRWLNYWISHYPNALFSNLYGPTEITVDCTYYIIDRRFEDGESIPIGKARSNCEVLILNEANKVTKLKEIGEILVRGSLLGLGYWNDPESTSKSFVQNPLHSNYPDKVYRTGDLGYWNDQGEIIFIGRKDTQIKRNGYRIDLGEIESAALKIQSITNVCVLYEAQTNKIALFYETSDQEITHQSLLTALRSYVPKYMIPDLCSQLDKLPLNTSGKVDRKQLQTELNTKFMNDGVNHARSNTNL